MTLNSALQIGSEVPDFELPNQFGEKVKLSSFRGVKNVVVVFFPFAFTGTCTGELCALRDDISLFQNEKVELLAISCDAMFTQKVFAEKEGYQFPLLSDFWPHGKVASQYGVLLEERDHGQHVLRILRGKGLDHRAAQRQQFHQPKHYQYQGLELCY